MKKAVCILIAVLLGVSLTNASAQAKPANGAAETAVYTLQGSPVPVEFAYPAQCAIEDEGSIGVIVRLDENNYVSVCVPREGMSGTAQLAENIGDLPAIRVLQNGLHAYALHGDPGHRRPGVDIVTAGIDLEDGTGLILNAEAEYGCTEIYPVLLTVLSSVTDAAAFDEWLNAEWLPGLLPY